MSLGHSTVITFPDGHGHLQFHTLNSVAGNSVAALLQCKVTDKC